MAYYDLKIKTKLLWHRVKLIFQYVPLDAGGRVGAGPDVSRRKIKFAFIEPNH